MTDTAPDFATLFGRPFEAEASATGCVNLIGEHTDYNDGFVLPVAIPQKTVAQIARRPDTGVRAWSANVRGADQEQAFGLGMERTRAAWIDYVQGLTRALAEEGVELSGFDMRVESDVPLGAGLSSSASLEVAVLRALVQCFSLPLTPVDIARVAHQAETRFVGVPVGMTDQMTASLATENAALFIDTRSLTFEQVPIPSDVELLVIDSGMAHDHAGGEYQIRRAECEEAARVLGVPALRDADADLLATRTLRPPLDRRARHVVSESERVIEMRLALTRANLPAAGALMNASHRSIRDDFEVSTPEIDHLVALAQSSSGVVGARLTGGGLGRCVVALAARGHGAEIGASVATTYTERMGKNARVLIPQS